MGAILADNAALDEVQGLTQGDFFLKQHRVIFKVMEEMRDASEPVDVLTLREKLHGLGSLEEAGGFAYVNQLASDNSDSGHVEHYVKIVRRKSMLRRIVELGEVARDAALYGNDEEVEKIVDRALVGFMDVAESAGERLDGDTSKQAWWKLMEGLEANSELRVFSGIRGLDAVVGGFRAGELVTITASLTGAGKTLFAQQIKRHNCKNGLHGIYFSGEMSAEQLAARELATEARVAHWKMRQPEHLTKEEYSALVALGNTECEVCRTVDGDFSIRDVRIASRRMKRKEKLSWIIVDYDELVDAPGRNEIEQQTVVAREAKRLAVTLEVPLLMISGIRKAGDKEGKNTRPLLDQVYGSGAKVKHSTFVLFVDRKWVRELKGDESEANIWILKAREGRPASVKVAFNTRTLRFEDAKEGGRE